jgi:hypothetical protein
MDNLISVSYNLINAVKKLKALQNPKVLQVLTLRQVPKPAALKTAAKCAKSAGNQFWRQKKKEPAPLTLRSKIRVKKEGKSG